MLMTESTSAAFESILSNADPARQDLAKKIRALIYQVMPQVTEVVWTQQKNAGYGTGPKKMSEHFCWIAPFQHHVLLGFNYGSELPDPTHLLEGTGKLFRHVKLRSADELHNPAVRTLLEVASKYRVPPLRTSI
jgi:hypothetical protein